jgi:hypothetical protein
MRIGLFEIAVTKNLSNRDYPACVAGFQTLALFVMGQQQPTAEFTLVIIILNSCLKSLNLHPRLQINKLNCSKKNKIANSG